MNRKNRAAFAIYKYKAELGMAALSISFGIWLSRESLWLSFLDIVPAGPIAISLILIGILRVAGIASGCYFIREWSANLAVLVWTIFFAVSLYIRSNFSIVLLALLIGAIVIRASQKIERDVSNGS